MSDTTTWIPVTDGYPEFVCGRRETQTCFGPRSGHGYFHDDKRVLVRRSDRVLTLDDRGNIDQHKYREREDSGLEWERRDGGPTQLCLITHWMPEPELPEGHPSTRPVTFPRLGGAR